MQYNRLSVLLISAICFCATIIAPALPVSPATCLSADEIGANPVSMQGFPSEAEREQMYELLDREARLLEAQARVVRTVAKLMSPTVVHIEANMTRPSSRTGYIQQIEETGSGVIIRLGKELYVLTNRHVIKDAELRNVRIELADGRKIQPVKIWSDPDTDIGVMQVEGSGLVSARIGDSDRLDIGDFVLAVGSPFGLNRSVSYGIVSAKGRRNLELGTQDVKLQDFIQTDAAINPGNSGGPLVNLRGEVVGIITAIASNSGGNAGVGFAIPIDAFMTVTRQLVTKGRVSRAFLGVTLDGTFEPREATAAGMPYPMGAHVTRVVDNSPASDAGLQVGDIILKVDNVPIDNDDHLINVVNLSDLGEQLELLVFRDKKAITVKVQVKNREF